MKAGHNGYNRSTQSDGRGSPVLLKYSVSNFRSFRDKVTLSMQAGSQRTLGEIVLKRGRARILPVAVVHGANASGKRTVCVDYSNSTSQCINRFFLVHAPHSNTC